MYSRSNSSNSTNFFAVCIISSVDWRELTAPEVSGPSEIHLNYSEILNNFTSVSQRSFLGGQRSDVVLLSTQSGLLVIRQRYVPFYNVLGALAYAIVRVSLGV